MPMHHEASVSWESLKHIPRDSFEIGWMMFLIKLTTGRFAQCFPSSGRRNLCGIVSLENCKFLASTFRART